MYIWYIYNIYIYIYIYIHINIDTYMYIWYIWYIRLMNRTSCAQVHQLPQSHCGDNREGTLFS